MSPISWKLNELWVFSFVKSKHVILYSTLFSVYCQGQYWTITLTTAVLNKHKDWHKKTPLNSLNFIKLQQFPFYLPSYRAWRYSAPVCCWYLLIFCCWYLLIFCWYLLIFCCWYCQAHLQLQLQLQLSWKMR